MSATRYPIYVPSKGRHVYAAASTARFLVRDRVPFRLVINEEEAASYAELLNRLDPEREYASILLLPRNEGGLIFARNWIKDHSTADGYERHWQLDDNIESVWRIYRQKRLRCDAGPALAACEDFTDRYENIGISGLNYVMWTPPGASPTPFRLNCHVYSASLIWNQLPFGWRLVYNDDTDICLRVLARGLCTVQFNAFLIQKLRTMIVKGGNTDALYQGDGRLKMARSLERVWPGVVRVDRRWGRPQHVIDWRRFRTPLKLKPGLDALEPNEYGMRLVEQKPIQSPSLKAWASADEA